MKKTTENDKKVYRTSFDLTPENAKRLKEYSIKTGKKYTDIINDMIEVILSKDEELNLVFEELIEKHIHLKKEELKEKEAFEKQQTEKIINYLNRMKGYFVTDEEPDKEAEEKTPGMRKINLKQGYVIIPDKKDWIILDNYSKPEEKMYVGVVETRQPIDGKKTYDAKHYVFFCDYKYGNEYTDEMEEEIFAACIEKDPEFKTILDAKVEPKYNGKHLLKNMINIEEYKAAPIPGLFNIVEKGDPNYWTKEESNYEPPFGAMIIR